ncbi:hypothetical protein SAY87_029228 [Trapa incisa]|uniref:RING-type E3 ubiquitin transferase n=1 Tax=Trapa incisa TaxID=236973 RepID=A0AAN7KZ88_9MYRT|nr:hypothetical protein SAY87_029228 [Trapa incisa]
MKWVLHDSYPFTQQQFPPPPPPPPESGGFSLRVNLSIPLIIIILAIIFFISGLLHLLVRFLMRPPSREMDELESVTALQGQLQQLFHLHDAGVDQSFIDTLPLGKFKNVDGGDQGSSSAALNTNAMGSSYNVDSRRCFSMGSFEYVMDETATLQVPIRTPIKKPSIKSRKPLLRAAMSECDCHSRRYLSGRLESTKASIQPQNNLNPNRGGEIVRKKDSFSISKIWMREKGEKPMESEASSSRRAFSFRFPVNSGVDPKNSSNKVIINEANRTSCEIELGSEIDDESRSCYSLDYSQASSYRAPSFTRRTLLWLMGRQTQNKVGHSPCASLDHV